MEGKDKKKESIDEILSDLNGLLNKMPSILDGIKMPELQPLEQPKPQQAEPPAPASGAAVPEPAADKTVALPPFSGLPEGAPEPAAELQAGAGAPPAADYDADKTVVLPSFSGLPEGAPEPAQEKAPEQLAPQSLGDFMFGEGAQQTGAEPPAAAPAGPAKLSGSALEPPSEPERPAAPEGPSLSVSEFTPPEEKNAAALPAYEATRDFGVPDIDALMQLSESGAPAAEASRPAPAGAAGQPAAPEAGVIPAGVREMEAQDSAPVMQGLEAEERPAEVDAVENNEFPKEEAARQEQEQPVERQPDTTFDSFAIDAAPQEKAQPALDAGGETLRLEPAQVTPSGEALQLETPQAVPSGEALQLETPQAMPSGEAGGEALPLETPQAVPSGEAGGEALQLETPQAMPSGEAGGETLRLETAQDIVSGAAAQEGQGLTLGQSGEQAQQPAPASGGIELSPAVDLGPSPAAGPSGADQTLPGGIGLELGGGSAAGDATLVVPQPSSSGSSGEEEKTVIFQASPSTTSRAQAGDLAGLAAKQPPEGIPAERLRSLMFVYSMEDKALCATVLAELDSICLKSAVKPMFIKRAAVRECDPDVNPNFLRQSATESGAQGLVCLGNVPGDKISEIEGVFSAANGFFRYYDSNTFNHSAALDLVTDLIVR